MQPIEFMQQINTEQQPNFAILDSSVMAEESARGTHRRNNSGITTSILTAADEMRAGGLANSELEAVKDMYQELV